MCVSDFCVTSAQLQLKKKTMNENDLLLEEGNEGFVEVQPRQDSTIIAKQQDEMAPGRLSGKHGAAVPWLLLLLVVFASSAGGLFLASKDTGRMSDAEASHWRTSVLLVSLDGFRPDYLGRGLTPNLNRLASEGIRSVGMQPCFPSVTFPNHYSLVTGMYPESHGITANVFFEPMANATFKYTDPQSNADPYWWKLAEPVWITATRQGKRSATCMWPGSETTHDGLRPDYWVPYNSTMPLHHKVDLILNWMDLPLNLRPSFYSLYFPQVDGAGHTGGIHSQQVTDALGQVDDAIGYLLEALEARGMLHLLNIVVVSDHGMMDTPASDVVFVDDFVDTNLITYISNGPLLNVRSVDPSHTNTISDAFIAGSLSTGTFSAYLRNDVPAEYHYTHSQRIGDIVLVANPGFSFAERKTFDPNNPPFPKGNHGFNNSNENMRALFIAHGSAFNEYPAVAPAFPNINLYNKMCDIMGITPVQNNGSSTLFPSSVNH